MRETCAAKTSTYKFKLGQLLFLPHLTMLFQLCTLVSKSMTIVIYKLDT